MTKRLLLTVIVILLVSCKKPQTTVMTGTTPPSDTPTLVAATQTNTPIPMEEAPVYDLGPIPGVSVKCLFQRQGEALTQQETPTDGSWRQFRHDAKLTGKSSLIGDITCLVQRR